MVVIYLRKINYIRLAFVFVTILVSFFTFLATRYEYALVNGMIVPFALIFAIPIFISYKCNDIKNPKVKSAMTIIMTILYILDVTLLSMLIVQVFGIPAYFIDEVGSKLSNSDGILQSFQEFNIFFMPLLFMTVSWLMIFINFSELDKIESKTNNYLMITVSLVILLIHINFYINPNLQLEMNIRRIGERAPYIIQNYPYFVIMYGAIFIKKFLNKSNIIKN